MRNKQHSKTTLPPSAISAAAAKENEEQHQLRTKGGVMRSIRNSSSWMLTLLFGALAILLIGVPALALVVLTTTASRELGQPDFVSNSANTPSGASQNQPTAVAIDKGVSPNHAYVVDNANNRVLVYTNVTTLVNGGPANLVIGQPNLVSTACNVSGRNANSLCGPNGIAVDASGRVYVADSGNNRVVVFNRVVANNPAAIAVFGQGGDFTSNSCNLGGGPSRNSLCNPIGVAIDGNKNVYVADFSNARVVEYNSPFAVTVPGSNDLAADAEWGQGAGSGTDSTHNSCDAGGVTATSLCQPVAVTLDANNNVYVADWARNRVLVYNQSANPPNNFTANKEFGQGGGSGIDFTDSGCNPSGLTATTLCQPDGLALDSTGNLYISDYNNNRVIEFNESAIPPTNFTANHVFGQNGDFTSNCANLCGTGPSASTLFNPDRIAVDSSGSLYVADINNNRTVKYNTPLTSYFANVELGQLDFLHRAANTAKAASLNQDYWVAVDSLNHLYVCDSSNSRVLGFPSASAFPNNENATMVFGQPDFATTGGNSTGLWAGSLNGCAGVAVDKANNLYIADYFNNRVLVYFTPYSKTATPGSGDNIADVVIGQGGDFNTNGCNLGGATSASGLCNPTGIAIDPAQNLWVADSSNHRVLAYYTPLSNDVANLVLGQPDFFQHSCNQGAPVSGTTLCTPEGVASDTKSNIYVGDMSNKRVLEFNTPLFVGGVPGTNDPSANLVIGQPDLVHNRGNQCGGVSAQTLSQPGGVALDPNNNLYVGDQGSSRVVEFNAPLSTNQAATRVFGQADSFTSAQCNFGGGGPSISSECFPFGVALDSLGNLYVADRANNRVLQYDPPHFNPDTVTFGHSGKKTVYLVNTTGVWLNNIILSVGGDTQNEFKIGKTACTNNLAPKARCKVPVIFHRKSRGVKTATLTASDDATNTPQQASLTGGHQKQ